MGVVTPAEVWNNAHCCIVSEKALLACHVRVANEPRVMVV